MKTFATAISALVLATGIANASGIPSTYRHDDSPDQPVTAAQPIEVKASQVLSAKELVRRGLSPDAEVTVSNFSAPGTPNTYER